MIEAPVMQDNILSSCPDFFYIQPQEIQFKLYLSQATLIENIVPYSWRNAPNEL